MEDKISKGFTLIELLLALSISALVAVLAFAGIDSAIDSSSLLQGRVRQLSDLQRTLNIMEEDLLQIRPRAITNGFNSREAALRGGMYQDVLLEFTRGGLDNPLQIRRSELQRVRYVLDAGNFWRQSWTVLDRADVDLEPQSVLLLENVDAVELEFLPQRLTTNMPPDYYMLASNSAYWEQDFNSMSIGASEVAQLPMAVRVNLSVTDFGQVERVFELP